MEQLFIVILVFLALLAVFDLFVGVSNDAVNFLNSAIGSRIATFRTIMIVASLGVLIGATFSSGMMSIARNGVFNPEMFTFYDVIFLFFGVMATDILLLDTFNSLGMPTSTTVSIVCELLGGAMAAAACKLWLSGASLALIGDYINSSKVLSIISGILVSVVVAFIVGAVVQFVTRLIFSFNYQRVYRRFGGVFGGIALTAIFYFLVMKGAKGCSFMHKEYLEWINANTMMIVSCAFVALTVFFQALILLFRVNVFKIIILAGTFALAFSFAGNDLVNFVGVPLAALDSYNHYAASGAGAAIFTMEGLKKAVQTPTFYLLLAGLIMVLTLWFSKKAHRVVQTSINLSSSAASEHEQFGSSLPGRMIVRGTLAFSRILFALIPASVLASIGRRMDKPELKKGEIQLPFDQVRASINLIVASILIACATSLKLPLSTTYVTFMVAMGTSFADGAWDRESAVYRISGVLAVISGWFLTAISAFTACAVITGVCILGGEAVVIAIMLLVCFILIRGNFRKSAEKTSYGIVTDAGDVDEIREVLQGALARNLDATVDYLDRGVTAFMTADARTLRAIKNETAGFHDDITTWRGQYYMMAHADEVSEAYSDVRHIYYRSATNMKEVSYNLRALMKGAEAHIANQHKLFGGELRDNLGRLPGCLRELSSAVSAYLRGDLERADFVSRANALSSRVNEYQDTLLRNIEGEKVSMRSTELYMAFLQFTKDVISRFSIVAEMQRLLNEYCGTPVAEKREGHILTPSSRLAMLGAQAFM